MEYINLHVSVVDGEVMQDAGGEEVRTWLFLMRFCAGQENGGRIAGARGWSARKWLKCTGLEGAPGTDVGEPVPSSLGSSDAARGLWHWEGDDLVVEFYPVEQERVVAAKRRGGRIGGRMRQRMLKAISEVVPKGVLEGVPERKGREGKEKERKVKEAHPLRGGIPPSEGEDNHGTGGDDNNPGVSDDAESDIAKNSPRSEAPPGAGDPNEVWEAEIPTMAEVLEWAGTAGVDVDPRYAQEKWEETGERHGWVVNGRLLDWRRRWRRYWVEDKEQFATRVAAKASRARLNGSPNPAAKSDDQPWWWSEDIGTVERALTGALLGADEKNAARLREVLTVRRGMA